MTSEFSPLFQVSLRKVVDNACKQYVRSRPPPSSESVKRSKEMAHADMAAHPLLGILLTMFFTRRNRLHDAKSCEVTHV